MTRALTQNPSNLGDLVGRIVVKDFKPYRIDKVRTYQDPANNEMESILSYVDVEEEIDTKLQMQLVETHENSEGA